MLRSVGAKAEEVAARYLAKNGLKIIAKNVTYSLGELDLVAKDGETLVFIEVKYRRNDLFSSPAEAVTTAKQKKVIRAAQAYLQKFDDEPICRFDVVLVQGDLATPTIDHIRDAFVVEE